MSTRRVSRIFDSIPTIEGAGVHLARAFGHSNLPLFDPFLMLDDFHTSSPDKYMAGFPWHPHRGIETVTYILEGLVEHSDSMGNKGVIGAGDVQWMTAGSGIIHQEMPQPSPSGVMWGFQLWANLPASQKMTAPCYREIKATEIPTVNTAKGSSVKVICGTFANVNGPLQGIAIDPVMLDISIPADSTFDFAVKAGYTLFAYLMTGTAFFDTAGGGSAHQGQTVLYEHDGDLATISTAGSGVRLLLLSGKPLNEPIAWGGPIVMNSQAELKTAFEEYRNGTFIK